MQHKRCNHVSYSVKLQGTSSGSISHYTLVRQKYRIMRFREIRFIPKMGERIWYRGRRSGSFSFQLNSSPRAIGILWHCFLAKLYNFVVIPWKYRESSRIGRNSFIELNRVKSCFQQCRRFCSNGWHWQTINVAELLFGAQVIFYLFILIVSICLGYLNCGCFIYLKTELLTDSILLVVILTPMVTSELLFLLLH